MIKAKSQEDIAMIPLCGNPTLKDSLSRVGRIALVFYDKFNTQGNIQNP